MASLQAHSHLPRRRWGSRWIERLLSLIRRPLVTYVIIATAVSGSFVGLQHKLESRTDHQIVRSVQNLCKKNNDLVDRRLAALAAAQTDPKVRDGVNRVRLLGPIDCKATIPER